MLIIEIFDIKNGLTYARVQEHELNGALEFLEHRYSHVAFDWSPVDWESTPIAPPVDPRTRR